MKILYDTLVLIAALLEDHSNHALAFPKLQMAKQEGVRGYLSSHSLAELYSVITRLPKALRVLPNEAHELIKDMLKYLSPVALTVEDYQRVIEQAVQL